MFGGLTFAVGPGQFLEITGPNGSGKTTLLRALAGIEPIAEGTLDVTDDDLALLGHRDGLKGDLTVEENLRFWAEMHGRQNYRELMDRFEFLSIGQRPVRFLSAGQRKRAALASLMASERRIWLLDEPLTALDPGWAGKVIDAVTEHCTTGGISVITTLEKTIPSAAAMVDLSPTSGNTRAIGGQN